jgi:uncharacterized protein
VAECLPPLLLDTRTSASPKEVDPIVATLEALPAKYACATLSTRGRKLGKVPQRTADAYAKCQAALAAPGSRDLRACLQLSELLRSAPRDEVLRDNINARACARGSQRACRGLAESRLGSGVRFDPVCAEQVFEVLCEEGELTSCFQLGTLKLEGELVPEDAVAGRGLIHRACDEGEYMACLDIVRRENPGGAEATRIVERAFGAATKACAQGEAEACRELSWAYAHAGQWFYLATPAKDQAKQLEMRQAACVLGSLDACARLDQHERTDVYKDQCDEEPEACTADDKDDALHTDWYFRRCAAGWDSACEGLQRTSRRQSSTTAARANERGIWLESGCLRGTAGACRILSLGTVVPLAPSEKTLQTGCDLGLATSCEKLAEAAEARGDRVKQLEYLERACPAVSAQGHASTSRSACRVAGVMYKDGVGAAQDLGRAAILFQKGCVERRYVLDGEACAILGTMYEDGVGVQKSLERALDLYAAGCADESYRGDVRSRAEHKLSRLGGPESPAKPAEKEPTACERLHQWIKPKSTSSGGP